MLMDSKDWETLNRYVDGELDAASAADVADAIARDRTLAALIATLARLKAVSAELGAIPLAEGRWPPPRRSNSRLRAMAASVLLLLAVGAGFSWAFFESSRTPHWLLSAEAAHSRWLSVSPPAGETNAAAGDTLLEQAGLIGIRHIPDLAAAQLRLAWLTTTSDSKGMVDGVYAGYVGVHGCRLGLWMGRGSPDFPWHLALQSLSEIPAYAWQVNDFSYAVLARGMDPARLHLLAETIERLTRQGERLDDGIRTALARAPGTGLPCGA